MKGEWRVACEEMLSAEESESIWQFFNVNFEGWPDDRFRVRYVTAISVARQIDDR